MGKLRFNRFPGATLVETIISLLIILVMFGIATTILIQTNGVSSSAVKIKADYLIDLYADEADRQKNFSDDKMETDLFIIEKTTRENTFNANSVLVRFSAIDKGGKVISYQNRIFRLK